MTIYKFIAPESTHVEQLIFEDMLRQLYESYGMTPEQFLQTGLKITELPAKSYPILEELLPFIERAEQEETNLDTINYLRNIKQVIGSLVRNFGNIFNGHTSIDNLIDIRLLTPILRRKTSLQTARAIQKPIRRNRSETKNLPSHQRQRNRAPSLHRKRAKRRRKNQRKQRKRGLESSGRSSAVSSGQCLFPRFVSCLWL